ncbi:MAG: endonuclease/exonuclease/phosphatase family protein [Planctomycetaceae bacterium]
MIQFNPAYRTPPEPPKPSQPRRARWLLTLSLVNLLGVLVVAGLLRFASEDWWRTMPLVYLPKMPLLIPSLGLIGLTAVRRVRWVPINLASLILVLGPIMGFVLPVSRWTGPVASESQDELRLVSCNIQAFKPNFPEVIGELALHRPDVVVFQEVRGDDHPLLREFFKGWHVARDEFLWVGSKFPVRLIKTLESQAFSRVTGILVEVDLPAGPVRLANLHFMTARRALTELSPEGMLDGRDRPIIESHQRLRDAEMLGARDTLELHRDGLPLIAAGDFNTPADSSLLQRHWGDFQNAFNLAGFGFGYTSPCGPQARWFDDTPWVRIDHILCSHEWDVVRCEVGTGSGSDHRLIAATLRRRSR